LLALVAGTAFVALHVMLSYPEGTLPVTLLFLTYSVGANAASRQSLAGLVLVYSTLILLTVGGAPGMDAPTMVANFAWFGAAWTFGIAVRARRQALDARVSEAEERAEAERQQAARVLAEERLRIARELHDVVAHSMSVIAVQAGVGSHVIDEQPEQARASLDAISATSRQALNEMRRLLGALRDGDGERSNAPAPGLADVDQLVDDVRAAGVPVELDVSGTRSTLNSAIELSAYRVVQEALTNVIKHAGPTTRVDVVVRHAPGSLTVEVNDDGRGAASSSRAAVDRNGSKGHGLIGMRERVEIWGGELVVGPSPGGGFKVHAVLPYGDAE
jgi:signal transduction histidine kinase